jgi:dTDP-4-amino-4,6-dideoxygalactose transaminase
MDDDNWRRWPHFDDEQIAAVEAVLRSGKVNYWTGEQARAFEREFAAACASAHGVALANGSLALELALHVLGVGPGDEVVVTPRSFVASASSVLLRGARPVFADVDPVSQNITADTIRPALSARTKAIIAVHLAGWPCEMAPLLGLARERGLKVIEDCAQAHGALYRGRPVGSFGDVAAFSFCHDKIMTTGGEGGMLVTSDEALWRAAWAYKDHGKSYDAVYHREHSPGFRWLHETLGSNWRMTEMQAVIGRMQLTRLPDWLARRRRHAARLTAAFREVPALRVTEPPAAVDHAYYKYYTFVRPQLLKPDWSRDRLLSAIAAEGVPCFNGSCSEIYLEKLFERAGLRPAERLPVARELGETSLMLLVHPTLAEADIRRACRVVAEVCARATVPEVASAAAQRRSFGDLVAMPDQSM